MPPEVEPAGGPRRARVSVSRNRSPGRGEIEQPVDGLLMSIAAEISEACVEKIFLAVGPESVFAQPIRPRSQKGYAAELGVGLQSRGRGIGEIQDVAAAHTHLIRHVADRGDNG